MPQRLYLYLASGLPIFAILPEGEASSYIRETGCGIVIPPTDINMITQTLREWIINGAPPVALNSRELVKKFSKSVLAERFYSILQEACNKCG